MNYILQNTSMGKWDNIKCLKKIIRIKMKIIRFTLIIIFILKVIPIWKRNEKV